MATATLDAPQTERAARAPARARVFWRAFFRVFNLTAIAVVFYLCLATVASQWLPLAFVESFEEWFFSGVRFLRQNLISGYVGLLAIALVRGALAGRAWSRTSSLVFGLAVVALAAGLGAFFRLLVYGVPLDETWSRWPWAIGIIALWTTIGGFGYVLIHLLAEDEEARRAFAEEACARDALTAQTTQAHLSALQAQIEPHFLFNTLANVKRLYETAPGRGRAMLSSLIDYLHAALPSMRQSGSTVRRELDLARSYLTVLQMRMGDRLQFSIDAPAELLDNEVPPLVLATLLENAVKHGLSPLPEGGRIDVRVREESRQLLLEVRDTGQGFVGQAGSGVGLANTRSRLSALYANAATLDLTANAPRGVVATVRWPQRVAPEVPA
ncbi:MAG TPA: histidine kinase [Burkholderiaceae bacterium]|nr:histidine kinase [Burkholderiaceae bacterium]